jgi:NADH-quinone oxidoreductase subunit K
MSIGLTQVLLASAALLAVGIFAVVARRNIVTTLLGTQLMLLAGAVAFVAFGRFGLGAENHNAAAAMALFVGVTSVAELGVGLTMAILLYRESRSFAVDAERF